MLGIICPDKLIVTMHAPAKSLTEQMMPILRRPVERGDLGRAALHVLDWIGCAFAGSASQTGRVFLAEAQAALRAETAASVIAGPRINMRDAVFANGAFGNVLEMDDVHRAAILHPGPVVVPAALAAAEGRNIAGDRFLRAVIVGYEADIRIGRAVGPGHYAKFHNTATCGPFGAAAAVAHVLGLADSAVLDALGNAGTQAGGVWQCRHEPVMTKQLHTARAAVMGYEAAVLAARGLTGPRFILDGPHGFFAGLCPDAAPDRVTADRGASWLIHETSFKPWPACRHCHPVIDAALFLRDRVDVARIRTIRIETYRDAVAFCDRATPTSVIQAKFSLQHAVAVALVDGPPALAAFEPAIFARSDIARLRTRVQVVATDRFTQRYPAHFGAAVTVMLDDASEYQLDVPDALGDPENPLAPDAVIAKARMLMAHAGVSAARSAAIIAAACALPDGGPVRALTSLFTDETTSR